MRESGRKNGKMSIPVSVSSFLKYPDSELVIGLVAPIGVDLSKVAQEIGNRLKQHFSFHVVAIHFSELLSYVGLISRELEQRPEALRITSHMNAGNKVRMALQRGDALALLAVNKIAQSRSRQMIPERRTAYLLRSLKHPDEVRAFRQVYGDGFFLLAIDAAQQTRLDYLTERMNIGKGEAEQLIKRDEAEGDEYGQRTRDTFELADAFLSLQRPEWEKNLWRLIDLILGCPFGVSSGYV